MSRVFDYDIDLVIDNQVIIIIIIIISCLLNKTVIIYK